MCCFSIILHVGDVSLSMVMTFFSSSDEVPPMDYPHEPVLNFNQDSPYPTSSTCALVLTLPTRYMEYDDFKLALDTAFIIHGGFGLS